MQPRAKDNKEKMLPENNYNAVTFTDLSSV
jgi:hypothetical protein